MRKITQATFLLVFFVLANAIGVFAQRYEVPKIEQYKLQNGLTVILCEDHSLPQAYGKVAVKAGAVDEPMDATGLAHYLEHVMFKGTQNMGTRDWEKEKPVYEKVLALYDELGNAKNKKDIDAIQQKINETSIQQSAYVIPNEYTRLLSEIGGSGVNANTGYDHTQYLSYFPAAQIEKWLTFYSNSMQNPVFRSFQAELETVYEEYNMYQDMVYSRIGDEMRKVIFPTSPYGRSVIGFPEHLKKPSLNKLIDFYNTWYVSNNMALILVGDFNSEEVKPMIERTFGTWKSKDLPKRIEIKETPFKGRQVVNLKIAPAESVNVTYRTVPFSNEDTDILDICGRLLNNGQTGYLDRLSAEGVFTSASAGNSSLNQQGVFSLSATPNLQHFYRGNVDITSFQEYMRELNRASIVALEESEKELMSAIEILTDGNFTEKALEGVKEMMINSHINMLESIGAKGDALSSIYFNSGNPADLVTKIDHIKAITKDDVIRVAKKYFGKDYVVFIMKRGSTKPSKLEKPTIKPLEFHPEGESAFAKQFRAMPSPKADVRFVDFEKDAEKMQLKNGDEFIYSKNPVNDIFSLSIRFDVGTGVMKELKYAYLMNYAGAGGFNVQSLKAQMNALNCRYSISADLSYLYVSLSGPESSFSAATNLISLLINNPKIDRNIVSSIMSREDYSRRMEKEEADDISGALLSYVLRGDKSPYLDRLSLKALGQLTPETLLNAFKKASTYSATIFCSGNWESGSEAKALFEDKVQLAEKPVKGNSPYIIDFNKINENTIYFVHSSNAKQSQIKIFANGKPYDLNDNPIMSAFNNYYSGSFNGIIMQEIREKRSMAYGASASYNKGMKPGKETYFTAEMSTQDDKTNAAIDVLMSLIRDMPQYADRMGSIKEYLTWSGVFGMPGYRGKGSYIESNERLGYTEDPLKNSLKAYEAMQFNDIVKFWQENIKDKPMAITIVGDKSRVNLKELAKYGKVVEYKIDDLFSKEEK